MLGLASVSILYVLIGNVASTETLTLLTREVCNENQKMKNPITILYKTT